ncbi:MAG TPA: nuclear transport factor 2 family protein [Lacunisphaera sp.]|nr:nuclear transport factor 2 family protein [Lacunisphaera sp.]
MTTKEIATKLVAHCRQAKWEAAQRELYAANAVSREPVASPGFDKETQGLEAIVAKGRKFDAMIEKLHALSVSDPLVADNSFALTMSIDVTMKGQPRKTFSELCVYEVKDGKIASEQFFM